MCQACHQWWSVGLQLHWVLASHSLSSFPTSHPCVTLLENWTATVRSVALENCLSSAGSILQLTSLTLAQLRQSSFHCRWLSFPGFLFGSWTSLCKAFRKELYALSLGLRGALDVMQVKRQLHLLHCFLPDFVRNGPKQSLQPCKRGVYWWPTSLPVDHPFSALQGRRIVVGIWNICWSSVERSCGYLVCKTFAWLQLQYVLCLNGLISHGSISLQGLKHGVSWAGSLAQVGHLSGDLDF